MNLEALTEDLHPGQSLGEAEAEEAQSEVGFKTLQEPLSKDTSLSM